MYFQTFKSQIEKQDQYNGQILVAPNVKLIFVNIPAIYNIHLVFSVSMYFQTFKSQIEKQDQYNGQILVAPDVKLIFGNIPAIYNIHLVFSI